ncbi:MAG: zinc transporter ZntB [Sneathiella sp.]|nr:zinc transporter ZntB [Sneathiella sp.]
MIIHSFELTPDGQCNPLTGQAVSDMVKDERLAWVHLDANHPDTENWLRDNVDYLDQIIIDALLAEETRPRVVEHGEGAMLILRGVNLNENADPEDMISIRLWVDRSRIISLQKRNLKAVKDIVERLEEGRGPKNAGEFLTMLSSHLFERMEPVFSELDDRLDDLEETIIADPDARHRQDITYLRKQAILFRRYIAPQKDVMVQLRTSDLGWLEGIHKRRLQEVLDRITRYVEDLDAIRERAQIVKDELANSLADRMNKNMYVLSLVAAIFLPLGFLTGLLGINVGGMPGTESTTAFWIVSGVCAVFAVIVAAVLKWLRWY